MNLQTIRVAVFVCLAAVFAGTSLARAEDNIPPVQTNNDATIPQDEIPTDDIPVDDATDDETVPEDTAPAESTDEPAAHDAAAMNPAPADPSLLPVFKDFGELPGLTALMDDFMTQLLADPRTRPFFEQADQASVKKHLTEQFCVILGGPCTYTGRDMKTVHAELGITRGNFNALVEDLQIVMAKRHVPFHSQNKLLAKLAPMHRDIETR